MKILGAFLVLLGAVYLISPATLGIKTGSIFGGEFSGEPPVRISGGHSYIPFPDFAPNGVAMKSFDGTYDGTRSFIYGNDGVIVIHFEGQQQYKTYVGSVLPWNWQKACNMSGVSFNDNPDTCSYRLFVNGKDAGLVYGAGGLQDWFRISGQEQTNSAPLRFFTALYIPLSATKPGYNDIEIKFNNNGSLSSNGKFRIYVEPKECTTVGEFVIRQTAVGAGNTISFNPSANELSFPSANGTQKENNVIFCHLNPVQEVTATGTKLDNFPYDSLANGGTITVPAGETWVFTWKAKPSTVSVTLCADGQVYNAQTNACTISPTVEYVCTDGQFDAVRKACVVQANSEIICSTPGAVYNQQRGVCEKIVESVEIINNINYITKQTDVIACADADAVYNPINFKCEKIVNGVIVLTNTNYITKTENVYQCVDPTATYNKTSGNCEKLVATQIICNGTLERNGDIVMCIEKPDVQIVCPSGSVKEGTSCNIYPTPTAANTQQTSNILGAIAALGAVAGGFWLFRGRKK